MQVQVIIWLLQHLSVHKWQSLKAILDLLLLRKLNNIEAVALQSGAIMNRAFQPHESHVPFLLQFKVSEWILHIVKLSGRLQVAVPSAENRYSDLIVAMQIDFNLYGMGQLRLGNALFRHPLPDGPHLRQGWAESPNLYLSEGKCALSSQQGRRLTGRFHALGRLPTCILTPAVLPTPPLCISAVCHSPTRC